MANAIYASYSATGAQTPIVVDDAVTPFIVNMAIVVVGTANYGVQFTLDDVNNPNPVTGIVWFDDPNLPSGTATSGLTSYILPIKAILVSVTSLGASSSVNVKLLQCYGVSG